MVHCIQVLYTKLIHLGIKCYIKVALLMNPISHAYLMGLGDRQGYLFDTQTVMSISILVRRVFHPGFITIFNPVVMTFQMDMLHLIYL